MSDVESRNVQTPRLGLNQPDVGDDVDGWGDLWNANATILDQALLATGGTMTGALVLAADGAANLQPVSLQQLNAALALKAALASPAFTGVATAPTAAPGTNTTQLATTAFVAAAISGSVAGVSSFNTRTGVVSLLAADITGAGGALLASPAFTGAPTVPTAAPGTNTTQIASTAFVGAALPLPSSTAPAMNGAAAVGVGTTWARADHVHPSDTSRAPLASPTFTGTVTIPSGALIAGYATAASVPVASTALPIMNGTAAVGTGTTWARADHVHPSDTSRLPLTGGSLSGTLSVAGAGISYTGIALSGHNFAFGWDGTAIRAYVDGTDENYIAMRPWVGATYLPLAGGTLTGATNVNAALSVNGTETINGPANDPLTIVVPSGNFARIIYLVTAMRQWDVGVASNGSYSVTDASASATRLIIDMAGNCTNTTGTWAAISDRKTKLGMRPFTAGLNELLRLQPISFKYHSDLRCHEHEAWGQPGKHYIGLDAEAAAAIIPELAGDDMQTHSHGAVKTTAPGMLVFPLLNAIKELAAQNRALADRLTAIETILRQ